MVGIFGRSRYYKIYYERCIDASIRDYYPYNKNSFLIAVAHILEISR